jgi:glycosyltransferase involved in cell wall biosynthesis
LTNQPLFSIVVPAYNRERQLRRTLESCAAQTFTDCEVIVVDDGSRDKTRETAASVRSLPVKILAHEANLGVCAARQAGVQGSVGKWVVFLDSDDELLPDALDRMYRRVCQVRPEIGRLGFMYRIATGGESPFPTPRETVLDYRAYLRWSDRVVRSDICQCVRRETFETAPFPTGRAYERIYHLTFAAHFRTLLVPEVAGIVHRDAPNRVTGLPPRQLTARLIREAEDEAAATATILREHGAGLRQYAPRAYNATVRWYADLLYVTGRKRVATGLIAQHLTTAPLFLSGWATLAFGLVWPRGLLRIEAMRRSRRR